MGNKNKIGRNDPCHCGSGKKFKKCCIPVTLASSILERSDVEWQKLRQLEGIVIDKHLSPYSTQELPREVGKIALLECFSEDLALPAEIDRDLLFDNFFIPWFLFTWIPFEELSIKQFDSETTIAQNYLKTHISRLNSEERRFIEAMHDTYYSFYSILEVEVDKKLIVKDIMLGTTHIIKERQGTHHLKRGDIIFSRILTMNEQSIFIGMAPYLVQTRFHQNLIDLKQLFIKKNDNKDLTYEVLLEGFDFYLRDYYFELLKMSFKKPKLFNTDNELIQFSKSRFKLSISPEETLKLLLPLTWSKDPNEFLNEAKRDKLGLIKKIEIPWLKKGNKMHKSWETTIMGHITIENNKLTLETNSVKRTAQGKKLLNKHLSDSIVFQQTLIESPEQMLDSAPKTSKNKQQKVNLHELPEIQEQIQAMTKAHWENWFDAVIPALGNKTPREAARTSLGRERLEALFLEYERHNLNMDDNLIKADINYLKAELTLN